MKIIVTGASGLIGSELVPFLESKGHDVKKLVRKKNDLALNEAFLDPDKELIEANHLEGSDAVINLAGENIAEGRWSEEKKKRIFQSRVNSTRSICQAIASLKTPPKVLINASAIGYYGDRGEEELNEESAPGSGTFLSKVCCEWEVATRFAMQNGVRVICLRIGVVLSEKGGALPKMMTPFKIGLGGALGSGEQYISWVALEDLIEIIYFALNDEKIEGAINAVSPEPVKNKDFAKTLGSLLHRPTLFTVPAFAARLAFGEMADEPLLASAKASPMVLQNKGFKFKYPQLKQALGHILNLETC